MDSIIGGNPSQASPASDYDLSDLLADHRTPRARGIPREPATALTVDRDSNGNVKKTPHNAATILVQHTKMRGVFAFDEFHDRVRIVRRPEGRHFTGKHWEGGVLSDAHSDDVRMWFSASPVFNDGIGTDFPADMVDSAIKFAARRNRVHPIRDWLESLPEGDGEICRTEGLFVDYLGCPNTPYHREAARLWLIAAVARVYEPGHKFDFMPIIEGAQGARKSTCVKTLGGEWFGAPTIDWSNSQKMIEQTEGYWIIEVGELATLNRGEANDVKECIVKTEDRARMAYARNPVSRRRQFVFMGTTNDEQYLRDPTGNRRYWPIKSTATQAQPIDTDALESAIPALWAEALFLYRWMREERPNGDLDLSLSSEAEMEARALQGSRKAETAEDVLAGQIEAWLARPIGAEFDDIDRDVPKRYRSATCTAQIWTEMLDGRGAVPHSEAMKIGKALALIGWKRSNGSSEHRELKSYGRCVVYSRV